MRGFRNLVVLGVLLVTLLLVIDTIDAGKKQGKKKELETEELYDEENSKFTSKNKKLEDIKYDKLKKSASQRTEKYKEENQYVSKGSFESKKSDSKKNLKFASQGKKYTENEKIKTAKYLKKKSQILKETPIEKFDSSKVKGKKTKPQYLRSENIDKIVKTVKKTTQKKLVEENKKDEKIMGEKLDKVKSEEFFSIEDNVNGFPKKRKYKLIEDVVQEDVEYEEQEENESEEEPELEDQVYINIESEEMTEKKKYMENPMFYIYKTSSKHSPIAEVELNDEFDEDYSFNDTEEPEKVNYNQGSFLRADSYSSKHSEPEVESCQRSSENTNLEGAKKITLYVVEEEIDGKVVKKVVPDEDGVTMCEVADILNETYFNEE